MPGRGARAGAPAGSLASPARLSPCPLPEAARAHPPRRRRPGRATVICRTCGVQQAPGAVVEVCPVCADDRQYVPPGGQRWTSLQELRDEGARCELAVVEPGVTAVNVRPRLGIGQRALHVRTGAGAVLWDCVGFIDDDVVAAIGELGGVDAIAVSHPHFYGAMVEWAHAFSAPIWIPEADRQWVQRPDPAVRHWSDEVEPVAGARLVQCAAGTSTAARCSTSTVTTAQACSSSVTPPPSPQTGATSRSCAATPTTCPWAPRPSAGSPSGRPPPVRPGPRRLGRHRHPRRRRRGAAPLRRPLRGLGDGGPLSVRRGASGRRRRAVFIGVTAPPTEPRVRVSARGWLGGRGGERVRGDSKRMAQRSVWPRRCPPGRGCRRSARFVRGVRALCPPRPPRPGLHGVPGAQAV